VVDGVEPSPVVVEVVEPSPPVVGVVEGGTISGSKGSRGWPTR
jgi:hypothetical protein